MRKKLFIGFSLILLFFLMGALSYGLLFSSRDEAISAYNAKLVELNIDCSNMPIDIQPIRNDDDTLWTCDLNNNCVAQYRWRTNYMTKMFGSDYLEGQYQATFGNLPTLQEARNNILIQLSGIIEPACEAQLEKLRSKYTYTTN